MISKTESCIVAPPIQCNHATTTPLSATNDATSHATVDLMALAIRVLERSKGNQLHNLSTTDELHRPATTETHTEYGFEADSCTVAFTKGCNHTTQDTEKRNELEKLIWQVSTKYGGDDERFLIEYINNIAYQWSHDLDRAINCFKALA